MLAKLCNSSIARKCCGDLDGRDWSNELVGKRCDSSSFFEKAKVAIIVTC